MNTLLVTILPSLCILAYFIYSDKFPEPKSEILKVFALGVLITIPAFFLNTFLITFFRGSSMSQGLINSFFSAAPVEEGLKLSILYFFVYKRKEFNEPIDGIVYGICASLGFATLENIYYVYMLADHFRSSSIELAILRAFSAIPAHAVFGMFMGYFFTKYSFVKKEDSLLFAFLVPFILHGCYNLFMYSNFLAGILLVIISWIVSLKLFFSLKLNQKKKKHEDEKKI